MSLFFTIKWCFLLPRRLPFHVFIDGQAKPELKELPSNMKRNSPGKTSLDSSRTHKRKKWNHNEHERPKGTLGHARFHFSFMDVLGNREGSPLVLILFLNPGGYSFLMAHLLKEKTSGPAARRKRIGSRADRSVFLFFPIVGLINKRKKGQRKEKNLTDDREPIHFPSLLNHFPLICKLIKGKWI